MAPDMQARVEEGSYQTRVRIDRSDIGALLQVAANAAEAKICDLVRAVVLTPNNVINLVRQHRSVGRQTAILANVIRPVSYSLADFD